MQQFFDDSPETPEETLTPVPESPNKQTQPKTVPNRKPSDIKNPYVQARITVLASMSSGRQKEMMEYEKTGNTDNRFYMDFVKSVMREGDRLTE